MEYFLYLGFSVSFSEYEKMLWQNISRLKILAALTCPVTLSSTSHRASWRENKVYYPYVYIFVYLHISTAFEVKPYLEAPLQNFESKTQNSRNEVEIGSAMKVALFFWYWCCGSIWKWDIHMTDALSESSACMIVQGLHCYAVALICWFASVTCQHFTLQSMSNGSRISEIVTVRGWGAH